MNNLRALAIGALVLMLSGHTLYGQVGSHYRDFQLGGSVPSIVALTGAPASQAKIIHARPALMQELEWRPSYFVSGSTDAQTDPVQQIVFSFYNDQLFRLVVDYDRQRTEGMTDADLIGDLRGIRTELEADCEEDQRRRVTTRAGVGHFSGAVGRRRLLSGPVSIVLCVRL